MPPILVAGAAGRIGGIGRILVGILRLRGVEVRAFVRTDDARAAALRALGAEIFVGDLSRAEDLLRALDGVRRLYFGTSISSAYLETTATAAVIARHLGGLELFLNISQMTVSGMSATHLTDSPQHRQQWLAEQILDWSGLPVVHLRPTVLLENPFFLDWAAQSIARDGTLGLPFGGGRTSPVAARDVAEVAAAVLLDRAPRRHVYDLTGPKSEDLNAIAAEYASALGKPVRYVDVPLDAWLSDLQARGLPAHLQHHLATMAHLHAADVYNRSSDEIQQILGRPATSVREFVTEHADVFRAAALPSR
jgi:uncharacterized protein YbjT (DUF2867 family)